METDEKFDGFREFRVHFAQSVTTRVLEAHMWMGQDAGVVVVTFVVFGILEKNISVTKELKAG